MGFGKRKIFLNAHYYFAELLKNRRKKREDCLSLLEADEFRSARQFF
jgi:hypothetical protein